LDAAQLNQRKTPKELAVLKQLVGLTGLMAVRALACLANSACSPCLCAFPVTVAAYVPGPATPHQVCYGKVAQNWSVAFAPFNIEHNTSGARHY
jgi:hypothetical protein